ncbi:MAG TPA: bacteriohopanetetrol glucosamine biosynthesis glycosyltransferase HpnI [Candidatus Bathyarchaeia archaeon]|nr:bacteriohopanetetrol glucosamine biosynthesis glycosyltransferase HpnI [Candidatus Bathyarchaeia archaeon]
MLTDVTIVLLGLVFCSSLYWLFAYRSVARFRTRSAAGPTDAPPITILKPVLNDDGQLYLNLRSFCEQDYPRYEILFGVRSPDDPAVPVVERLTREFPQLDLACVVTGAPIGSNRKVSTLDVLSRRARYDMLVVADADMRVTRDYLRAVAAPLADPSVGLVTCLYRGVAVGGVASTLGAMFINEWLIPGAIVGTRLAPLRNAFGATLACRQAVLAAIGGFAALADYLADDYVMGEMISRRGLRVELAPYLVSNIVVERSLRSLVSHELRWARTFRTVRPLPFAASMVTHGIALACLLVAVAGPTRVVLAALAANVLVRCGGQVLLYRRLGLPLGWSTTLLVPFRDVLSFVLSGLSFLGRHVQWGNECFTVDADGKLHPVLGTGTTTSPRALSRPTRS